MELHDIGWAVRKLNLGEKVYRTGWNGPNQYLRLVTPDEVRLIWPNFIAIFTTDEYYVPWTCSQTDLLAEDWELLKPIDD